MNSKKNGKPSGLLFDNYKNADERDYMASVYLGHKRQGKTSVLYVSNVQYYNYNIEIDNPRSVLIVDPSNAKGFKPFQPITMRHLRGGVLENVGIYRIDDGEHGEEVLKWIVASGVTNIKLVIDEARNIFPGDGNLKNWQKAIITNHSNYGIDIDFVFHGFMDIHRKMRSHIWKYTIFKTPEIPDNENWFSTRGFPPGLFPVWQKVALADKKPNSKIQEFQTYLLDFDEYAMLK